MKRSLSSSPSTPGGHPSGATGSRSTTLMLSRSARAHARRRASRGAEGFRSEGSRPEGVYGKQGISVHQNTGAFLIDKSAVARRRQRRWTYSMTAHQTAPKSLAPVPESSELLTLYVTLSTLSPEGHAVSARISHDKKQEGGLRRTHLIDVVSGHARRVATLNDS